MKKMVALLLAAVMACSVTACGSKDTPAETDSPSTAAPEAEKETGSASGDQVVITFASREDPTGSDAASAYQMKMIEKFNEMDNGIHVDLVWNTLEADYLDRLATDIASGDCPNVFLEYGGSRVLDYLDAGLILDMTPYYEEDPDWYDSVYEAMWTPCLFEEYGYEGIYGIPYDTYEVVLVYNSAYLEQCNLEVPRTWEELMHCCKVLKENHIQPFMVGEKDSYRLGHLFSNLAITSYGEDAIKIGNRETGYDSEEAKAIYQMIIDAYEAGYFGDNILSYGASEERVYTGSGECAFTWDLTSRLYWLEDSQELNAGNLHVTHFPAVREEYYGWCQGGASRAFYISAQASEEEIAASVEFLKYYTSQEFVAGLSKAVNSIYSIKVDDVEFSSYIYDEAVQVVNENKGLVSELQNNDSEAAGLTIVRDALQSIVLGATAEDLANTIVEGYEDIE